MGKLLWIGLGFIVVAGLTRSIYTKRQARLTVDVASVGKDIREHLPIGSPRSAVEAYLDQKGFPHSYTDELKGFPEYQNTEAAMVKETSNSWLVRGDLQILFKFDGQERLIDYKFKEILTGP